MNICFILLKKGTTLGVDDEVILIIVIVVLFLIYFMRKDFMAKNNTSAYCIEETDDRTKLIKISERMIEYTISLGDEVDRHGISTKAREIVSIINLHLKEIERLRMLLGSGQTSTIVINIEGNKQPFYVFLFGLHQILKELEKVSGLKFSAV